MRNTAALALTRPPAHVRLHAALEIPRLFLAVRLESGRRRRVEAARLEAARDDAVHHHCRLQPQGHGQLGRHVGKTLLRRHQTSGRNRRREERVERGLLVLVIEARANRHIQPVVKRRGCLPIHANPHVVERRLRRVLTHREGHERREHERRERVDRILFVVLREQEDAGLPPDRDVGRRRARARSRRSRRAPPA